MARGDTRCIDGRLFRHQPFPDDPYYEHDVGQCSECQGEGCNKTCAVCGCDEVNHLGLLTCECPAPKGRP